MFILLQMIFLFICRARCTNRNRYIATSIYGRSCLINILLFTNLVAIGAGPRILLSAVYTSQALFETLEQA